MKSRESFAFRIPGDIHFGMGASGELASHAKRLGATTVLLVTDETLCEAGVADGLRTSLETAGLTVGLYNGVLPEPPTRNVDECVSLVGEGQYDCVVGLGGGSVLDVAKATALVATNGGSVVDYLWEERTASIPALPKILLPTTAGTGSEASRGAVFTDTGRNVKRGMVNTMLRADVAIVDPEFTLTMPPRLTATTGMDAFIHALESFIGKAASPMTELFSLEAIRLIARHLRAAVLNGEDIEARTSMALASLYGGLSSGNAFCGVAHALSNPIGNKYHLPHGTACFLTLGATLRYNCLADLDKFRRIGSALGLPLVGLSNHEAADKIIGSIVQIGNDVGLPQCLRDVGATEDELEAVAEGATQPHLLANNPCFVDRRVLLEIVHASYDNSASHWR